MLDYRDEYSTKFNRILIFLIQKTKIVLIIVRINYAKKITTKLNLVK